MPPIVAPPAERLLVFARLPELGAVKTRLAASVGAERALAIYEAMLRDTLARIGDSTPDREVEVLWAPTAAANHVTLTRAFGRRSMAMQTGASLTERMSMAFSERFFFHRAGKIIAIGVDDPSRSRELLDHAFHLLDACEWVVGPAVDGGYYLIGCRAAAYDSGMFIDIDWGTSSVLETTLSRIKANGTCYALLPERPDIDTVEDLHTYETDPDSELARLLGEWGYRTEQA